MMNDAIEDSWGVMSRVDTAHESIGSVLSERTKRVSANLSRSYLLRLKETVEEFTTAWFDVNRLLFSSSAPAREAGGLSGEAVSRRAPWRRPQYVESGYWR